MIFIPFYTCYLSIVMCKKREKNKKNILGGWVFRMGEKPGGESGVQGGDGGIQRRKTVWEEERKKERKKATQ